MLARAHVVQPTEGEEQSTDRPNTRELSQEMVRQLRCARRWCQRVMGLGGDDTKLLTGRLLGAGSSGA